MAENCYIYGIDDFQDVNEAQSAIVAALDLLIEETRRYMHCREQILSSHETDEFQTRVEQFRKRVSNGEPKDFSKHDFEASKQKIRDDNTAELGGIEKRLRQLLELQKIFANTAPEQVSSATVDEVYRVFKLQIIRHVTVLGSQVPCKISLDPHMHLNAYGAALFACVGCQVEVYPFIDQYKF